VFVGAVAQRVWTNPRAWSAGLVMALSLGVFPVTLGAWTRASHSELAATALKDAVAFESYASKYELTPYLLQAVQDADNESEKVFTADLEKSYPGIRMIRGEYPTKVQHTSPILSYHLPDDARLHNALECLRIAHRRRVVAVTADERREAMRIFADGLHLVQDYFAHLNAPGLGKTGFSHGVGNPVDTNGDGVPDMPAGRLVDNVNWDCHSDHGNDLVPTHLRVINYFHSPFWHKHPAKEDSWRYQAALHSGIEYLECYLAEDGPARFEKVLANGYVVHGGVRTYLDLITHIAADNTDPSCALAGDWKSAALSGSYMSDCALATVAGAATSATWSIVIPLAGRYEIYLRWPQQPQQTSAAEVTVRHGGEAHRQAVDQRANGNRWNSLGRFVLAKDEKIAVALTARPGELVAADAVLLVRVPE
jgi:hypothetical protein